MTDDELLERESRRRELLRRVPGDPHSALADRGGNRQVDDAEMLDARDIRDDAHAELCRDETRERIDVIPLENNLRMAARELERLVDERTQAVIRLERDEGLRLDVTQRHALACSERMILRHRDEELLRPEVHPGDMLRRRHRRTEAEIRLTALHLAHEEFAVVLVELDADVGILRVELREQHGQQIPAEGMEERKVHRPAVLLLRLRELFFRRRELAQHAVDVIEEMLPCLRELRMARMTHEKRHTEFRFELCNRARERRL